MKWVKRGLWAAAWGVWLSLGFGLHRALPRDLGAVACSLPGGDRTGFAGFLGDESQFVTNEFRDRNKPSLMAIWDARTGANVASYEGPIGAEGTEYDFHPKHLFVLGRRVGRDGPDDGPSALDLKTGQWMDLPVDADGLREFHPEKPWVMFWETAEGEDGGSVHVFDLKTGKELFQWSGRRNGSPPRALDRPPFFVGDRIGIPTRKPTADARDFELEVWSIPQAAEPDQVVKGLHFGEDVETSQRGRILWCNAEPNEVEAIDVYDLSAGGFVFSDPPRDQRRSEATNGFSTRIDHPPTRLSKDGHFIHWPDRGRLWDIDRSRECWSDKPGQRLIYLDLRGRMEIAEAWEAPGWEAMRQETYAVRDAATGRLLYRTWKMSLDERDAAESLQVDFDADAIRCLPPPVNWPLLALCQTILALPLIILWAILRWRRKRRLRRLGQPLHPGEP